jgi:hypothetical protein
MTDIVRALTEADERVLRRAHARLEQPSLTVRITSLLGLPIEQGVRLLPPDWEASLKRMLRGSVERMLDAAIRTTRLAAVPAGRNAHVALGAVTGAVGGLFGPPALLLELPISTAIMLHGIAAIAREQGEDLTSAAARAECVSVFTLGARVATDDAAEAGYYGLRASLALRFSPFDSAASIGFVRAAASRLGVVVSDKAAAALVPVLGAACAGLVNVMFVRHFQDVAWGHFTIRRLERTYGRDVVEGAYRSLANGARTS